MTLWSVVVTHLTTVRPLEGRRTWVWVRVGIGAVCTFAASVSALMVSSLPR